MAHELEFNKTVLQYLWIATAIGLAIYIVFSWWKNSAPIKLIDSYAARNDYHPPLGALTTTGALSIDRSSIYRIIQNQHLEELPDTEDQADVPEEMNLDDYENPTEEPGFMNFGGQDPYSNPSGTEGFTDPTEPEPPYTPRY
ncbi:hypothetical protein BSR29_05355 [Boudabousia liubingyangii]|uniref:Uncharacterized protein n=1 Tax=Boudabousia liubingyangii TaxID=1921764 RepID=A0A1Q5PLH9_9ACTO|nr:hypothetical protein [Boudabousia liubingyangii]OKL47912.1 hypothetical protein BSR29_05355 [Boudabousia liubingyangii]